MCLLSESGQIIVLEIKYIHAYVHFRRFGSEKWDNWGTQGVRFPAKIHNFTAKTIRKLRNFHVTPNKLPHIGYKVMHMNI